MYIKSLLSILIVTSSFIFAFGQTPEAKKEKERAVQAYAFSFDGDGGYLGVQTQEVTKENYAKFGLRDVRGVAVETVMENSPAASAGVQNGDVIVKFNGEEVTSTRKLTRLISEVAADHQVSLKIVRNGREQELDATLGKRPMPKFGDGNFTFTTPGPLDKLNLERHLHALPELKNLPDGEMPRIFTPGGEGKSFAWRAGEGRQIGVGVYPVTKQLGERFGVDSGLIINNVRDESPSAKAGLKAGDIIVEADGKTVKNQMDLTRVINDKKDGDVQITIMRDRNRQTISVTPEASKDSGFFFQTGDDEDGVMPLPRPGQMRLAMPATPAAPMVAPAAVTMFRPGRVI